MIWYQYITYVKILLDSVQSNGVYLLYPPPSTLSLCQRSLTSLTIYQPTNQKTKLKPTNDWFPCMAMPMWIIYRSHVMHSNIIPMLLLAFMGVNMVFGWGCLSNKSNLFLHKRNYYASSSSSRSSLLLLTRHDPLGVISSCRTYYFDTIYPLSGSRKHKKQTYHTISNLGKYSHL
jgi:hypothetical protein